MNLLSQFQQQRKSSKGCLHRNVHNFENRKRSCDLNILGRYIFYGLSTINAIAKFQIANIFELSAGES